MKALLLLNLGTPLSPTPKDVGHYLREFLMDPLVIDLPWPVRWPLVNLGIVPKRAVASAALYEKIWTPKGSPLLFHTVELKQQVAKRMSAGWDVEIAMRYGDPSIEKALSALRSAGATEVVLFPLYPQYSLAATESCIQKVTSSLDSMGWNPRLVIIPPFYDQPEYLNAVAKVSTPWLQKGNWDKVLFSYHGLPERQVKRTDKTRSHCLVDAKCCEKRLAANHNCYRHQCFETTKNLANLFGLSEDQYVVGFQSRLGGTPWIKPYSDHWYSELPKIGVKRLIVLCPSFVADCLETLEEVQIRGLEQFKASGGDELTLVPSLNSEPVWADAVANLAVRFTESTGESSRV